VVVDAPLEEAVKVARRQKEFGAVRHPDPESWRSPPKGNSVLTRFLRVTLGGGGPFDGLSGMIFASDAPRMDIAAGSSLDLAVGTLHL